MIEVSGIKLILKVKTLVIFILDSNVGTGPASLESGAQFYYIDPSVQPAPNFIDPRKDER